MEKIKTLSQGTVFDYQKTSEKNRLYGGKINNKE